MARSCLTSQSAVGVSAASRCRHTTGLRNWTTGVGPRERVGTDVGDQLADCKSGGIGIAGSVSRSTPPPMPPSPGPAGTSRLVIDVGWIAFAQVILNFGHPSDEVPPEPSFGKEPQAGWAILADPLSIDELTHEPACTACNKPSHDHPPDDGQHIPHRVRHLLPRRPVQIPESHFIHLQPRADRGSLHPVS